MRRISPLVISAPFVLLLLCGCAARECGVNLVYSPISKGLDCANKITVLKFKDARGGLELGSTMKSELYPVNRTVEEWITYAVASEIEALGCLVEREVSPDSPFPPDFTVTGEIYRVYLVRDFWSYSLEISLHVEVRRGGADGEYAFRKNYKGEWRKRTFGVGESESDILAAALGELLGDEIMPELAAVLR